MDLSFFLRGLLIGFSIAAVVGPIGMLCIQRGLEKGFVVGLATGLGAATADGLYGGVAAFGLTVVSTFLVGQQLWIRLVGGLFCSTWASKP
jgi:threonine/homoserine/homoserine lactone efflux protein